MPADEAAARGPPATTTTGIASHQFPALSWFRPTTYATWASRNDDSPATNASDGSMRNTSPSSENTSATTNQARAASDVGSSASAAAIMRTRVSGLKT